MGLKFEHGRFRDTYGAHVVLEGTAFSSTHVVTLRREYGGETRETEDGPPEFFVHKDDLKALIKLLTEAL